MSSREVGMSAPPAAGTDFITAIIAASTESCDCTACQILRTMYETMKQQALARAPPSGVRERTKK